MSECGHRFTTNSTPENGHKTHCINCGVLVKVGLTNGQVRKAVIG